MFDVLDRDMTKSITRDDVFWGIECLCEAEVLLRDEMYTSTDLVWGQLTQQSDELVRTSNTVSLCILRLCVVYDIS